MDMDKDKDMASGEDAQGAMRTVTGEHMRAPHRPPAHKAPHVSNSSGEDTQSLSPVTVAGQWRLRMQCSAWHNVTYVA